MPQENLIDEAEVVQDAADEAAAQYASEGAVSQARELIRLNELADVLVPENQALRKQLESAQGALAKAEAAIASLKAPAPEQTGLVKTSIGYERSSYGNAHENILALEVPGGVIVTNRYTFTSPNGYTVPSQSSVFVPNAKLKDGKIVAVKTS